MQFDVNYNTRIYMSKYYFYIRTNNFLKKIYEKSFAKTKLKIIILTTRNCT